MPRTYAPGHCGVTYGESNNCLTDKQGSWALSGAEAASAQAARRACISKCTACVGCNYVSFSAVEADCSWYSACNISRLVTRRPAQTFWSVAVKQARRSAHRSGRLEFLEIGTSDFDTLIETSYPGPGKSVEALQFYQDRLPDRADVQKINSAVISETEIIFGKSNARLFFVHPKNISRFSVNQDVRGMSTIDLPNPQVLSMLQRRGLSNLLESVEVPTTSYSRLVAGAESIGLVKLDLEGSEPAVLGDLLKECGDRGLCPDRILFEHAHIHNVLQEWLRKLRVRNYVCKKIKYDVTCSNAALAAPTART